METKPLTAATITFADATGQKYCQTVFGQDVAKLVKTMMNYAAYLSIEYFHVYGSMIESLEKYWERTETEGDGDESQYTFH